MTPPSSADDFADWVRPHLVPLQRYAARLVGPADADDIVQEALVRAWRRRSTYDAAKGEPLPWLLAIARDRAGRHRSRLRPVAALEEVSVHSPDYDLDLERALTRLSPRQRQTVDLYYFVGLDIARVAAAMGIAEGTVRATLHQARSALHDLLGGSHD